ncbi:MAG: YggS family pyridoxal phosphate-dependent enzyme, partial [Smithellaceae bacterium]
METNIVANIRIITQRLNAAAARAGRDPRDIQLMAVSKTVSAKRVLEAIDAGISVFGENYVQEAREKIPAVGHDVEWHMIGHLQTNKAKYVVHLFDWIHSVDRLELALELDKRAGQHGRRLNVLMEVNVSGETSKSGAAPAQIPELVRRVSVLPNLSIRGMMTMPPYADDPEQSRPYFIALRNLRNDIEQIGIAGVSMNELSMGMTDDFEVAIEEGA